MSSKKGCFHGLWWSFLVFTATSLAPGINMRSFILKIFTVIWMLVSGVLIIIYIGMFSVSLTVYALNGQNLNKKIIGVNKHAFDDRIWLEFENAIAIEYQSNNQMFNDLNEMKLDFILIDQLIANSVYSKLIKQNNLYIMRKVNRAQLYNVLLNGFTLEQFSCIRTTSIIYSKQWFKRNLSLIKPDSAYFNLTDELLFPRKNIILLASIIVLLLLFMSGVLWQMCCMNKKTTQYKLSSKSFVQRIKSNFKVLL